MPLSLKLTLAPGTTRNEIVLGCRCQALPGLMGDRVADEHAKLSWRAGKWWLQDLGSAAGTVLNGVEVYGTKSVQNGDVLTLGAATVAICVEPPKITGCPASPAKAGHDYSYDNVVLSVNSVTIRFPEGGLENVSMVARKGELVGVLGPSGCGKSTLVKVIAGVIQPSEGHSVFCLAGEDSGTAPPIAYLPQDVIIHDQLLVKDALAYISAFKSLSDCEAADSHSSEASFALLGLEDKLDTKISKLSGGEKKRVGLAAELLGDPDIIILDEATSGLDPALNVQLMEIFRDLANRGKTVICVTHNPARLSLCDRVLFLVKGRLLFDGKPQDLVAAMQADSIDDVYRKANDTKDDILMAAFPAQRAALNAPRAPAYEGQQRLNALTPTLRRTTHKLLSGQLRLLLSRYAKIVLADWPNLLLLIGQAPAIALIVVATFGRVPVDFAELHAARLKEVFLIQVLAVLWCSGTASIREVVKEWPLLRHEQRYGLLPFSVLLSKFLLLSAMAAVQVGLLMGIVRSGCGVTGDWLSQLSVLLLLGCVGVAQGVLISTFARTSEQAMTILPVVLIGEAIISGGFARLSGVMLLLAMLVNPAYWALDGLRSTLSTELLVASYPGAPGAFQPSILGMSKPLWVDLLILAAHGLGFFLLAYFGFCRGLKTPTSAIRWQFPAILHGVGGFGPKDAGN